VDDNIQKVTSKFTNFNEELYQIKINFHDEILSREEHGSLIIKNNSTPARVI
jgi:hypothetical protein